MPTEKNVSKTQVIKVTLSSKRVVILREPLIMDTETAMSLAAATGVENKFVLGLATQRELLKLLLLQVDDKELSGIEKEQLDKHFKLAEFNELMRVIDKISGGDGAEKKPLEIEVMGSKG